MKKLLIVLITLGFVITLSACSTAESINFKDIIHNEKLSSKESLVTLSYLSGSFVDVDNSNSVVSSPLLLANTEETELETELEQVNVYMDRLKEFMENGTDTFGRAVEEVSDNPLYAFKISFTVNEEVYFIYYNVDAITLELSGILVVGDVEYVIEVSNSLLDKTELEDDEDENEDLDNEESEQKMVLTAYNGNNFVQVTYKVEADNEETETKFELKSNIDGVERKVLMKISVEEDELKIKIEENENEFTFKSEVEDDETVYKLKYKVNDVEGEVKIVEKVNELGETVYEYNIKEGNKFSKVEKDEPDYHSDDDDDEDEEEQGENNEI